MQPKDPNSKGNKQAGPAMTPEERAIDTFNKFANALLSPATIEAIANRKPNTFKSSEEAAFAEFRDKLTPDTVHQLDSIINNEEIPTGVPELARYMLVEVPDGEYPLVRMFRNDSDGITSLANRISELNGKDVAVRIFFGQHLPLTVGPQRYLAMPDNRTAITIPVVPGLKIEHVTVDQTEDLETEPDGFLGSPALIQTYEIVTPTHVRVVETVYPTVDDDDEDASEDE